MQDEIEYADVIRRQNRALRKIHKILRHALKDSRQYSDDLFKELCDVDSRAIEALDRIRTEGNIQCDSDDYEFIIFECLAALKAKKDLSLPNTD